MQINNACPHIMYMMAIHETNRYDLDGEISAI